MKKSELKRLANQTDDSFEFHRALIAAVHGAPRTSTNGGVKREYFELGNGQVIMFATELPENEDGTTRTTPHITP